MSKEKEQLVNIQEIHSFLQEEKYVSIEVISVMAPAFFAHAEKVYSDFQQEDPRFQNPSTVEALVLILEEYRKLINIFKKAPELDRLKLHSYIYVTTQKVYKICQQIQKNIYSPVMIEYLIECQKILKENEVIKQPKYFEWVMKIQITILQIFEDDNKTKRALLFAEQFLKEFVASIPPSIQKHSKMKELYSIYEIVFKSYILKYEYTEGKLTIQALESEVEKRIQTNQKSLKIRALVNVIKINKINMTPTEFQQQKELLKLIVKLVMGDLKLLIENLQKKKQEIMNLKKQEVLEAESQIKDLEHELAFLDLPKDGKKAPQKPQKQQQSKKPDRKVDIDDFTQFIDEKAKILPLEMHVQLTKEAFYYRELETFKELKDLAEQRFELFNIEAPYIEDIIFLTSQTPEIPQLEGYLILDVDLNEPFLKEELKRIRNIKINSKIEIDKKVEPPSKELKTSSGVVFTDKELEQIEYEFVFLALKKTYNPLSAVIKIETEMAHWKHGQNKLQQECQDVKQIPIRMYTGVKATYQKVPFIKIYREEDAQVTQSENFKNPTANQEGALEPSPSKKQQKQITMEPSQQNIEEDNQHLSDEQEKLLKQKQELEKYILKSKQKYEKMKIEEEKLNQDLNSDKSKVNFYIEKIRVVLDSCCYLRPDYGWEKMSLELRQVPEEFINIENLDYVFLFVKKQNNFNINRQILQFLSVFMDFEAEVEIFKKKSISNPQDYSKKKLKYFLDNKNFERILQFFKEININMKQDRSFKDKQLDIIYKIGVNIWDLYIQPFLIQWEYQENSKFHFKISKEMQQILDEFLTKMSLVEETLDILISLNQMVEFNYDLIFECKMVIFLAKLKESKGQYKNALDYLTKTKIKIRNYRDQLQGNFLRKNEEHLLPMCATTNNIKINEIYEIMKQNFQKWLEQLEEHFKSPSSENFNGNEILFQESLKNTLEFKKHFKIDPMMEHKRIHENFKKKFHTENELILITLECEIQFIYARCKLNINVDSTKEKTYSQQSNFSTQQLGTELTKTGKEISKINNNQRDTLINLKMLKSKCPVFQENEKKLMNSTQKNKYLKVIFMSTIATYKSLSEQITLFEESLKMMLEIEEYEKNLLQIAEQNPQYFYWYSLQNRNSKGVDLGILEHVRKETIAQPLSRPQAPLLMKLNSRSLTFCFPYFKPKLSQDAQKKNSEKREPSHFVLKVSNESSAADILKNSESSKSPDDIIVVSSQKKKNTSKTRSIKNQEFKFFSKVIYKSQEFITQGDQTMSFFTVLPLPLHMIYNYIGKISFQMRNYKISKRAFQKGLANILVKDSVLIKEIPNLKFYRLRKENLYYFCHFELQSFSEALLLRGLGKYFQFYESNKQFVKKTHYQNQIIILDISNLLMLSAELSVQNGFYYLTNNSLLYMYNLMKIFWTKKSCSQIIFKIAIQVHSICSLIPSDFKDQSIERLHNNMFYFLTQMCFDLREITLFRRLLCQEINVVRSTQISVPVVTQQLEQTPGSHNQLTFAQQVFDHNHFEYFDFILKINNKFLGFFDYFEETISQQQARFEDFPNKQVFLQEITQLSEVYQMISEQNNVVENTQKRFEDCQNKELFLLIVIENQIQLNKKIDFDKILEKNFKLEGEKQLDKMMEIKKMIFIKKEKWEPLQYKEKCDQLEQQEKEQQEQQPVKGQAQNKPNPNSKQNKEAPPVIEEKTVLEIYSLYFKEVKDQQILQNNFSCEKPEMKMSFSLSSQLYYLRAMNKFNEMKQQGLFRKKKQFIGSFFSLNMDANSVIKTKAAKKEPNPLNQQLEHNFEEILGYLLKSSIYSLMGESYSLFMNVLGTTVCFIQIMNFDPKEITSQQLQFQLNQISEISLLMCQNLKKKQVDDLLKKDATSHQNKISTDFLFSKTQDQKDWFKKIKNFNFDHIFNLFSFVLNLNYFQNNFQCNVSLCKLYFEINENFKNHEVLPFIINAFKSLRDLTQENISKIDKEKNEVFVSEKNKIEALLEENHQNMEDNQKNKEEKEKTFFVQLKQIEAQIEIRSQQMKLLHVKEKYLKTEIDLYQTQELTIQRLTLKDHASYISVLSKIQILEIEIQLGVSVNSQSKSREIVYQLKTDIIESFKKKNDYENFILSLHTLGRFYYYNNETLQAEESWNEAIDAVFQEFQSIQNQKNIFSFNQFEVQKFFVEKYNKRSLHIACQILYYLSKFVYFQNLEKQRQTVTFFNGIIFNLLSSSLDNPLSLNDFRLFSMDDNSFVSLFDQNHLSIQTFTDALIHFLELNIYYEFYLESLPLCCYLEFISYKLIFSLKHNVLARIYRSQCLAYSGFIKEAITIFNDICILKKLPLSLGNLNDLKKSQNGYYSLNEKSQYNNTVTSFDHSNKQPFEEFLKIDMTKILGLLEQEEFSLTTKLKLSFNTIHFSIFRNQNIEKMDHIQERFDQLNSISSRVEELISDLRVTDFCYAVLLFSESLTDQSKQTEYQNFITELLSSRLLSLKAFQDIKSYFALVEDGFLFRSRICQTFGEVLLLQNKVISSLNDANMRFSFLKKSLLDFQRFIINDVFVNLTEDQLMKESQNNKGQKSNKQNQGSSISFEKIFAYKDQIVSEMEKRISFFSMEIVPYIIVRVDILEALYSQKRYNMFQKFKSNTEKELKKYNEVFFQRKILALEARKNSLEGDFEQALKNLNQIRQMLDLEDLQQAIIYTDAGDIDYLLQNYQESETHYFKALSIFEANNEKINPFKKILQNDQLTEYVYHELLEDRNKIDSIINMNFLPPKKKQDFKKQADNSKTFQAKDTPLLQEPQKDLTHEIHLTKMSLEHLSQNDRNETIQIYEPNIKKNLFVLLKYLQISLNNASFPLNNMEEVNLANLDKLVKMKTVYLSKAFSLIKNNYYVPNLWKGQVYFLNGKLMKNIALYELHKTQSDHSVSEEHLRSCRFLSQKYLSEYEGLDFEIQQKIFPVMEEAKQQLFRCLRYIKGEQILIEMQWDYRDVYQELTEINVILSRYHPSSQVEISYDFVQKMHSYWDKKILEQEFQEFQDLKIKECSVNIRRLYWEILQFQLKIDSLSQKQKAFKELIYEKEFKEMKLERSKRMDFLCSQVVNQKINNHLKNYSELQENFACDNCDLINFYLKLHKQSQIFGTFELESYYLGMVIHQHFMQSDYFIENFSLEDSQIDSNQFDEEKKTLDKSLIIQTKNFQAKDETSFTFLIDIKSKLTFPSKNPKDPETEAKNQLLKEAQVSSPMKKKKVAIKNQDIYSKQFASQTLTLGNRIISNCLIKLQQIKLRRKDIDKEIKEAENQDIQPVSADKENVHENLSCNNQTWQLRAQEQEILLIENMTNLVKELSQQLTTNNKMNNWMNLEKEIEKVFSQSPAIQLSTIENLEAILLKNGFAENDLLLSMIFREFV